MTTLAEAHIQSQKTVALGIIKAIEKSNRPTLDSQDASRSRSFNTYSALFAIATSAYLYLSSDKEPHNIV